MQRIITVKLADVFPLEDEYGNQYASRDYSKKANQEYVQELAESMRMKGVPDEPIAVVEDGGIYRVKTGNSRVMAMRMLGTKECPAVVDDEDTVQSVLEAVVRTDVKKKYEPVERSRFVQQLALFGDDEYVSAVSGVAPDKVKRIRKARMVVDDAGDDMTIERMLLIEEFSDDPEAVKKLTECRESDASWIACRLRTERKADERIGAFSAAFALQGVPVTSDRSEVSGMAYYLRAPEPSEVSNYLPPEFEDGQVKALLTKTYDGALAEIYVSPELSGDDDPEKAELRRMEDAYEEALDAMDQARFEWFWHRLATGKPMPNLLRECEQHFMDSYHLVNIKDDMGEEAFAAAKNKGLSLFDYAMGFSCIDTEGSMFARMIATGKGEPYRIAALSRYLDELVLYQADGWDPGDAHSLIVRISELVDGKEVESEGEDD